MLNMGWVENKLKSLNFEFTILFKRGNQLKQGDFTPLVFTAYTYSHTDYMHFI